ncbi:MAG: aminocarboxymuconate-semialdehyde decarboxylase [Chloroflexi bacterium]|nr:aminocarboxymuconate-semialdehyde decarboxylase [Chloroflexota bacterium]
MARNTIPYAIAVAGIVFVGCSLINGAPAPPPSRRREVVVSGRRVKTVDVHAHCVVPEAMALAGRNPESQDAGDAAARLLLSNLADRLATMNAQGIDIEALSINPYWYGFQRDLAAEVIRTQNEKLADFCGQHSDRFVAFATVALQHPELAAEQLEVGVKKYGLRGVSLGASVEGQELADPRFHPFWKKAEELDILVFIHPQGRAELANRLKGKGGLNSVIGNPLDTTIALSHLIFEGTLDRFPGLKICAAHGGGYLPSYAGRSDAQVRAFRGGRESLLKRPSEYLRQLYYDSIVFTSEGLRHLAAETGPGQIMLGTDTPYPWTDMGVDHILDAPGFTDEERIAMLSGTACRLLGINQAGIATD